jgi:hypothetical protein
MALAQSDIEALTIIVQTAFKEMAKSMEGLKKKAKENLSTSSSKSPRLMEKSQSWQFRHKLENWST